MLFMMGFGNVILIFLIKTVVIEDSRKVKAKRREWVLGDYNNFLTRGLVSVHDILSADFVSMNICKFIY